MYPMLPMFLTDNPFMSAVKPIVELINQAVGPALALIGSIGAIYCIILGVKLAKAEEPQDKEKAKGALKNAIIGYVLIFALIAALNVTMKPMTDWLEKEAGITVETMAKGKKGGSD